jgi:hypothetical protein
MLTSTPKALLPIKSETKHVKKIIKKPRTTFIYTSSTISISYYKNLINKFCRLQKKNISSQPYVKPMTDENTKKHHYLSPGFQHIVSRHPGYIPHTISCSLYPEFLGQPVSAPEPSPPL